MPKMHRAWAVASLLSTVACGPAAVTAPPPPIPTTKPHAKPIAFPTPAHWALRSSLLRGHVSMGSSGTLYFGEHGERWLAPNGGTPTSSEAFLDEDLVSATRVSDASIVLVGDKGTLFSATTPLGPATKIGKLPTHARSTSGGKSALLTIVNGTSVQKSAAGALDKWAPTRLPKMEGRFVELAMNDQGLGLLLAMPQQLFSTSDNGDTWERIAATGTVQHVALGAKGDVITRDGSQAKHVLKSGPAHLAAASPDDAAPDDLEFPGQKLLWSEGGGVSFGGAIADGRTYSIGRDDDGKPHILVTPLGKPSETSMIAELGDCDVGNIAASTGRLVAACSRYVDSEGADGGYRTLVMSSNDGGKTLKEEARLFDAGRSERRVWISPTGTIIVKGACLAAESDPPCDGHGVIKVAGAPAFVDIKSEGQSPSFYALTFSADGQTAWGIGTAGGGAEKEGEEGEYKPRGMFVFRSNDGARSFQRIELPPPPLDADGNPIDGGYDEELSAFNMPREGAVALDDEGRIRSAAISYRGRWSLFLTDDGGTTFRRAPMPKAVGLAFVGQRGYAQGPKAIGYETLDGGRSWTEVAAPYPQSASVVCDVAGCLIGSRADRIGWALDKPGAPWTPPTAKPDEAPPEPPTPTLFGWTCTAEGKPAELGMRATQTSELIDLPTGESFASLTEGEEGVVVRVGKPGKKDIAIRKVVLLPPAKGGSHLSSWQSRDGVAVARSPRPGGPSYPVPTKPGSRKTAPASTKAKSAKPTASVLPPSTAPTPPPTPTKPTKAGKDGKDTKDGKIDVEIAWWSASSGRVHHATLKDVAPGEYSIGQITPTGVVVSHGSYYAPKALFAVSNEGAITPLADAPKTTITTNADPMRTGKGVTLASATYSHEGIVDLLDEPKGKWTSTRTALWTTLDNDVGRARAMPTWIGAGPAFVLSWLGSESVESGAWWLPIVNGDVDTSAARPLPLQPLASAAPKACGPESAKWMRVTIPYGNGSKHFVALDIEGAKSEVSTGDATLRVSPSGEFCVSAYKTASRYTSGGEVSAVVMPEAGGARATIVRYPGGKLGTAWQASCTGASAPLPSSLRWETGWTP